MSAAPPSQAIALCVAAACWVGVAATQATPQEGPGRLALTAQCSVPTTEIATPAPLPNLVNRLEAGQPLRILAIGSSPTWGVGAARSSPSAQLETMLEAVLKTVPIDIVSRGVSGETIVTSADRVAKEVALVKPDLVLWQVGTGEGTQRVSVEQFEGALGSMVAALRRKNVDVILVGLQYTPRHARDEHYLAIRDAVSRVAARQKVLYIRRAQAMEYIERTQGATASGDQDNRPEELAKECLAEHIAQAVVANIFVKGRTPPN
jgi:lysophospholipase L1-like esterase